MRFNYGRSVFGCGVVPLFDDARPVDPNKPDPRSAAEMRAFDRLPAEIRAAVAGGKYGVEVSDVVETVVRRGASNPVKERMKARGLAPCDVGTEGVVLEEIALIEERESARLAAELEV